MKDSSPRQTRGVQQRFNHDREEALSAKRGLPVSDEGFVEAADDLALGDILEAATYLQIRSLVDVASLEIRNCLGASTALRVWRLAASHGLEALAEVAATAACKHFKSLAVAEERMSFPVALVQALLADDRLRVGSE